MVNAHMYAYDKPSYNSITCGVLMTVDGDKVCLYVYLLLKESVDGDKVCLYVYLLLKESVDGDKVCLYVYLLLRKSVAGDKVCRVTILKYTYRQTLSPSTDSFNNKYT
jgi:hypothetical protein